MVKMCQVGSNAHIVGQTNASSIPSCASQENAAIRSTLTLLHEQLASVRALQRSQGLEQLALPSLNERQNLSISNGMPFSKGGRLFSQDCDVPVSPGGAMAARRLSFLRTNPSDDVEAYKASLPFGVRPTNAMDSSDTKD